MVWTGFWKYKKLPVKFQVSLKNFKLISVNKSLICRTRWPIRYKILVLLHLKRKLNKNIVISQLDRCKFKRRNKMIDVIKYKSKSIPFQNYIKIWQRLQDNVNFLSNSPGSEVRLFYKWTKFGVFSQTCLASQYLQTY